MQSYPHVDDFLRRAADPELLAILTIQNVLLQELQYYAVNQGFTQLMPLLLSPFTDPLNHQVYPAELQYEDKKLQLTASMIFHKQLSLIPEGMDKIFIMSPNIRLELASKKSSENHLLEFSQFDLEMKNASMEDVMHFIEGLFVTLFETVEKKCAGELKILGRSLPGLSQPFPRYSTRGIPLEKVDAFCAQVSEEAQSPCFITSFQREFYDRYDPDVPGAYRNFDLVYPQGYGEALSGAEREYIYDDIIRHMRETSTGTALFENYLEIARRGLLPKTAGAGIGIQRLLKFICGKRVIADVCLFDRSINSTFTF
ncbi:MAG TPA: asparagine synthetase A [Ktedonobacteraceae bacterium]